MVRTWPLAFSAILGPARGSCIDQREFAKSPRCSFLRILDWIKEKLRRSESSSNSPLVPPLSMCDALRLRHQLDMRHELRANVYRLLEWSALGHEGTVSHFGESASNVEISERTEGDLQRSSEPAGFARYRDLLCQRLMLLIPPRSLDVETAPISIEYAAAADGVRRRCNCDTKQTQCLVRQQIGAIWFPQARRRLSVQLSPTCFVLCVRPVQSPQPLSHQQASRNMTRFILLAFLALSLTTVYAETAPNILLILTDDHGWSQLSAQMDPRLSESRSDYLETPNMNRIMNEGMRFTSGYSPAPLCTPTRRSILCGTTAARSGTEFRSPWVPADHMTIPKALQQANPNYRCAHFGKWGEQMISTPQQCGYHASDGMTGNGTGGMPNTLGIKGGHDDGPPHFIDNMDPKRTRSMTDRAIEFMREQSADAKPFYVQTSYYAQHLSVVCSEEALAKYTAKGTPDRGYPPAWAAMMDELDTGVGRLLDMLDELKIADNTYVFFTADNGGRGTVPGGNSKRLPTNHPLSGAKHSLYEGGIRVPFMVRGPGVKAGSVTGVPVAGYDFLPTFFDLAGGTGSLGEEIDGISFRPVLKDPELESIRRPNEALIFHRPGKFESAIRENNDKLFIKWTPQGQIAAREFYRVDLNPTEHGHDRAKDNSTRVDAMEKRLLEYLASVNAEKPKPKTVKRKKQKKETPRQPNRESRKPPKRSR